MMGVVNNQWAFTYSKMADPINQEKAYSIYWNTHLQIYRQPLVWLGRVLTTKERKYIHLLAVLAFTNCLIMFLSSFPMPVMMFVGSLLLIAAIVMGIGILINLSNQFNIYPNWGQSEDADYNVLCMWVGLIHYKLKVFVGHLVSMRKENPTKFYGVGIFLAIIISSFGSSISTSFLIHALVNVILLSPLVYYHQLHVHLMNQNWSELYATLYDITRSMLMAVKKLLLDVLIRLQPRNAAPNQRCHVTSQPGHVTSQPGHMTSQPGHVTSQPGHMTSQLGHINLKQQ